MAADIAAAQLACHRLSIA